MDTAMTRFRAGTVTEACSLASESFDEIYAAFKASVFRFASAISDNAGDAEDLFQETWLRVARSRRRPGGGDLKPWLFTIASNLHKDALRKKRIRRLFFLERGRTMSVHRADADTGWDSGRLSGADRSALTELELCLRRALSRLPARQRQVFVLKEIEGFKHGEIGRMLGIPEATVRTVLFRAVKSLQGELAAFDPGRQGSEAREEKKS